MVPHEYSVTDELDGSPMLEVLGDALGKLRVFHAKLARKTNLAV